MKFFCLAELDKWDEKSIFLFPDHIDDEIIKDNMDRGLRTQTWGNWRRFQYKVVVNGSFDLGMKNPFFPNVNLLDGEEVSQWQPTNVTELMTKQLACKMKYICVLTDKGNEEIYVFPSFVHHDAMKETIEHISYDADGDRFEEVISAGFVDLTYECFGNSETLNKKSRNRVDTLLLKKQLLMIEG